MDQEADASDDEHQRAAETSDRKAEIDVQLARGEPLEDALMQRARAHLRCRHEAERGQADHERGEDASERDCVEPALRQLVPDEAADGGTAERQERDEVQPGHFQHRSILLKLGVAGR